MPEEIKEQEQQPTVEDNYIEKIKELKENTVSKDEYNRVLEDNRKLVDSLVNGQELTPAKEPEPEVDIDELRDSLFNQENNNLDYCIKALKLRDAVMKAGDPDPFLPVGPKIAPTDEDIAAADRVANALKDCIEYADGDSDIFTQELQRIMVDVRPSQIRR